LGGKGKGGRRENLHETTLDTIFCGLKKGKATSPREKTKWGPENCWRTVWGFRGGKEKEQTEGDCLNARRPLTFRSRNIVTRSG